jgi:hypothetical protein
MRKRKNVAQGIGSKVASESAGSMANKYWWKFTVATISALVLAFYIWTAGTKGVPFIVDIGPEEYYKQVPTPCLFPDISPHHYGFYNLMADAYSAGRADLLLDPPRELVELQNPWDPEQNARWRILDLSYYKGRYYLYFGPVPALTLFIPFRWLGIGKISEPLAVVIYCYGLFLCSVYILLSCVKSYLPNCNRLLVISAIFALGLSNTAPFILSHPTVYEVAIASAAFFSMLGLCFLLRAWRNGSISQPWLWGASLSFGLSVGCRPIHLFIIVFLFALWLLFSWNKKFAVRDSLKVGFALAFPFLICVAGIAWFNYIRFGSPGDFGLERQMNATLWDFKSGYRLCNIAPGLFLRAICPPLISDVFPFVRLHQFYPFALPNGYSLEEVSGGFLSTSPIILLFLCLAPFWIYKRWGSPLVQICCSLLFLGVMILLVECFMMFSNSMRYQLDFAPPILLASLVGTVAIAEDFKTGKLLGFLAVLLMWTGIVFHVLISLTGFRDTLRRAEPEIYFGLEDRFQPIARLLAPCFKTSKVELLDITPQLGAIRFSDGSEGYPIKAQGLQIRLHAPSGARLQISGDVILPGDPTPTNVEFHSPTGPGDCTELNKSGFHRWSFEAHEGSNRIGIFLKSDHSETGRKPGEVLGYLKNISISEAQR